MRTVAAYFRARQNDLKSEMGFDLTPEPLQRFAEKLFDFAAAEADDVRVFLFSARLIKVLFTGLMHQIEFVNKPAFLEELERAVNGDAVELWVFLLGELEEAFGIEVLAGLVDQVKQDLTLAGQAHPVF